MMQAWGQHFTCIAPDTPGFGQSDPLPDPSADIDAFADAVVDLIDALGLDRVAAYGFHSGGIILVSAVKRHPDRFTALVVGGYAVWTPEEMAFFGDRYLAPFVPSSYGEHLIWLWNRVLEQSWFFPWFAAEPQYRLSVAHADVAKVDAVVQDLLASGDAYRAGYGAVLRARRDIPAPDAVTPPVRITAYEGDPLQDHIDRFGVMPPAWSAAKVATPADHIADSLAFLRQFPAPTSAALNEALDEGFVRIVAGGFDGDIHWRGESGSTLHVHAPGQSLELVDAGDGIAIDLPGHGLSAPSTGMDDWRALIAAVADHFRCTSVDHAPRPHGDPDQLFPTLKPDRHGQYLTTAWNIVRAGHIFSPWYDASAVAARAFDPTELAPEHLAVEHRALLRATAARDYCHALKSMEN